jgi:hypothetical protein
MLTTEEATTIRIIDADGRRRKAAVLAAFFMSEQAAVDRCDRVGPEPADGTGDRENGQNPHRHSCTTLFPPHR